MDELAGKTCTACRGDEPPMDPATAQRMMKHVPSWSLTEGGHRLERTFKFPDFKAALGFVNKVGALAEEEGHHPDITFGWGYVTVLLYTHKIKGLHQNDFILAAKIDRI